MWAWENLLCEIVETKQEAMELMNSIQKHTCMIIDYTGDMRWSMLMLSAMFLLGMYILNGVDTSKTVDRV